MSQTLVRQSFAKSIRLSIFILKLIVPIYIVADIIFYFNLLSYISFLIEPFVSLLSLPPEAALAIISGMFLNLYAAIAFAAPLDMSIKEWSVLAIFLGVCHSLVIEGVVMNKVGISSRYSYALRVGGGLFIAYLASCLPSEYFRSYGLENQFVREDYASFTDLLLHSFLDASILALEVIVLMTLIIFAMDYIKSLSWIQNSSKNISKHFSIAIGLLLGITYGAGILIKEAENMSKKDMFFVATFLMICHSIIEDTLLFVIFGADFVVIVAFRLVFALIFAFSLVYFYAKRQDKNQSFSN